MRFENERRLTVPKEERATRVCRAATVNGQTQSVATWQEEEIRCRRREVHVRRVNAAKLKA